MQPGGVVPRPAVRRRVLRRDHHDADLLPPDLPRAGVLSRAAAVLRHGRGRGAERVPALSPLPARAGAGAGAVRRGPPARPRGRAPHRGGRAERPERRGVGAGAGRGRTPAPAGDGAGAGGVAGRAGPDPPAAPRQVPADRHRPAGHAGRLQQWISEPPAVQLGVPGAIPDEPERAPPGRRARPGRPSRRSRMVPVWCGSP